MPLAVVPVGAERPALSGSKVLSFDYGEPQPHKPPVDPITIGTVAAPAATEGRALKRQKIDTAPTMERLESFIRATVPDPEDPLFEEKMNDGLGKGYGVTGGKGRGQTSKTASPAATTVGSLRRTVDQMLKINAAATAKHTAKQTQATGGFMDVSAIKQTLNKKVVYTDAICADVPQNVEMVTFECASRLGMDDKEGWTIPAMVPVFYNPFSTGVHCCPPVYAHYKGYFHGEVAGVSLHDGLEAHELTREHASRRSIALAVGGVVTLSCDAKTANDFQVGDDVYIIEGQSATFDRKRALHAPRYFTRKIQGYRCLRLGRFVDRISKKHGGIRIVLDIGTWELYPLVAKPGKDKATQIKDMLQKSGDDYNPTDLYSGIDLGYAEFAASIVDEYNEDPDAGREGYSRASEVPEPEKLKALNASNGVLITRSLVPGYETAKTELTSADPTDRPEKAAEYNQKLAQLDRIVDASFQVFDKYARKGGDATFRLGDSEEVYFIAKNIRQLVQIFPEPDTPPPTPISGGSAGGTPPPSTPSSSGGAAATASPPASPAGGGTPGDGDGAAASAAGGGTPGDGDGAAAADAGLSDGDGSNGDAGPAAPANDGDNSDDE